ncbi:MAG: (2Fe-2S) ferredoxin domain-containing protein [Salinivirgaceae bacterium]|jgi:NADH:ubiquinone oxidoreductase subunit E|nr:(2Fe-2S) ferredoxin domain-containing protein [Salinivirgaceae bacterium]MDD4747942.1 (2Fe-2S) ferredoxin domain-containing protein [Salinivirgaceae bacterium]MDY0282179.1 (2Fe-2S) ferredoxin domain-containing protein [Salinivirgaceae bacterium]
MLEKKEITICLGSSCFARGNKKTLQMINNFIQEHNLAPYVQFKGGHCFGQCSNGPILKINSSFYENVDSLNVIDILNDVFEGYY